VVLTRNRRSHWLLLRQNRDECRFTPRCFFLYKGSIHFDSPMLCALGFIGLFTMGGIAGLFLASLGVKVYVIDTYFVVAHFHYSAVNGSPRGRIVA
jgi:heme/copper-type cytochrome/quinol oxidase subunit 1